MLPELIYREEQQDNYPLLFALGLLSGLIGYMVASVVFPSQVSVLAVVFASIPLVYPLTRTFLEDEAEARPHVDEIFIYSSLFLGEVAAFFLLVLLVPMDLTVQLSQFSAQLQAMGIDAVAGSELSSILTGKATSLGGFASIALHNLTLFALILAVSAIVSSSGAFILVWNASVLGVFLGVLVDQLSGFELLSGNGQIATPLAYVPHTTFEMAGFIIAGISGSLVSAAVYREHFDRETWIDYAKLIATGVGFILVGALLETA